MLANYRWFVLADLEAFTHCDSWTQVEECDRFFLLRSDNCLFTAPADFWSLKGKTTRWTAFLLVDNWACTPVFSKVINKKFYLKSKKNTISAKKKKRIKIQNFSTLHRIRSLGGFSFSACFVSFVTIAFYFQALWQWRLGTGPPSSDFFLDF